ncbi:MAG TPA: tail fiber domain-containing protein, partial [Chitinophagales bacterium]|nr:tail fiber domain-containing protein [Chitinophagales bacterium]
MKVGILTFITCLFFGLFSAFLFMQAQVPQRINYQAVARNASGSPLSNQQISLRIFIRQNNPGGVVQYSEQHNLTTDGMGLFNIFIGNGTPIDNTLSAVTWSDGVDKFLQVLLDPDGTDGPAIFQLMGSQQLVSVPYALYAGETQWVRRNNSNLSIGSSYALTSNNNTAIGISSLVSNTTGSSNVAIGLSTLSANTTGLDNTAIGSGAMVLNNTGFNNTAIGRSALRSNTSGKFNVASGSEAMYENTTGENNVAVGYRTLEKNTIGTNNTAIGTEAAFLSTAVNNITAVGYRSLYSNTSGLDATAIGFEALHSNTIGNYNTALGNTALRNNTSGSNNTAIGYEALQLNISGNANTAIGYNALRSNTTGSYNQAIGNSAMFSNTSGGDNVAIGWFALYNNTTGSDNVAIGDNCVQMGNTHNECTFVGADITISTNRTNVTALGADITNAQCTGNNQVLLGNTAIAQIRAQVTGITAYSDARFKTDVSDNMPGISFINKLKPVTYRQNPEMLHQIWGTPDSVTAKINHSEVKNQKFIGFLAQDVEQAAK